MSPTDQPTVSVVVPAYNAEETLEEAYESVANQEGVSWEMVIVDNNSTDATAEVAAAIAARDDRVTVYREERQGVYHARNRGIDEATGEFIAFFDSDDVMGPGALSGRVQAILDNPDCTLSYCVAEYVGPNLEPLNWAYDNRRLITYEHAFGNPCAVGSALLGRAEVIREVRFPPRTHGEDWLYMARLLRTGHRMVRADDCHVLYRQSADSAVHSKILNHERSCMEVLDLIYGLDPEVESAPEWKDGLSSPPLAQTKGRRLLRLLTYTLMAGDPEQANLAIGMLEEVPFMSPSKADVEAALTISVARAGHLPRNEVKQHWFPILMTIARTARAIKIDERFPAFATVLDNEVTNITGDPWLTGTRRAAPIAPISNEPSGPVGVAVEMLESSTRKKTAIAVRMPDPDPVLQLAQAGWLVHVFEPGESKRSRLYADLHAGMEVRVDMRRPAADVDWRSPAHLVDLNLYMATSGIDSLDLLLIAGDGDPTEVPDWIAAMAHQPGLVIVDVPESRSGASRTVAGEVADGLEGLGYAAYVTDWPTSAQGVLTVLAAPDGALSEDLGRIVQSGTMDVSVRRYPQGAIRTGGA